MLVIREETRYGFSPLFLSHLRSLARQADNGFDGDDGGDDGGVVHSSALLVSPLFFPCVCYGPWHIRVTLILMIRM